MYDTLIHSGIVLTLEPGARPLSFGFVAVQDGVIQAVGQACQPAELPAAREVLDAGGHLVMPGLVNTHCHAPMVWFRGLAEDLPLQEWLTQKIFPVEGGWLNEDRVYWGALLAAAEMIRGGTTTVADSYFYESQVRRALAEAGLRSVVAQGVLDFPCPGVPDPRDNLAAAARFLDSGADFSALTTSAVFCHTPYTCGPETLRGAKALTRKAGVPFFTHLAETRREVEDLRAQTGLGPAAYLDGLGILDELTVVAHGVWLKPEDLEILAARGVKVCHCPESNLKLASGVAPIPALLERGITVGLGSDGAASNNNLDLWGEISLAARLHKVWQGDPTVLPAPQTVALATREGAKVLSLADRTGSLAKGKQADLIVMDVNQPHLTPLFDPFSHLVYAAGPADVKHVMVAGRWLMKDRRLLTLDWQEIACRVRNYARHLAAFAAAPQP
jgi:5-methylthioadenosine/S-adenosylhomocysteine deaminase|uniref:5-methylthioadenosine/S-adenosylhomocysteine deaminase n=1 Tax=Desulfobacca acetoxidans TaxID=60893 RepID=A0A7V6DQE3_9BACT